MATAKKPSSGASAKSGTKATARKKTGAKKTTGKAAAKHTPAKKTAAKKTAASGGVAVPLASGSGAMSLASLRPAKGSWPKRTRVGRGHGSGMVKTGGEGGKGQTVRSGGGKGPAFEGGQTPWARRLPHNRGYSQKARDIGHFRVELAVVNLHDLADWDSTVEVTPQTLKVAKKIKHERDGVKILGGSKPGKSLPGGMRFRDVLFTKSAREALQAAGAKIEGE
jgi:large subunit ribosomal protein L15